MKETIRKITSLAAAIVAATGCERLAALEVIACMRGLSMGSIPIGYSTTIIGNPGEELTEYRFVGEKGTYIETF